MRIPGQLLRWRGHDLLAAAWVVVTLVVWGAAGFHRVLGRDPALYVYAGQEVADGLPPYVGVMNRAGPLAHLLPGLGVWLGRSLGTGDVVGARLVFFLLAALAPALVYLTARDALGSRLAGCAAAAAMLGFQGFAAVATSGPHSKQPMVMLVALALLLVVRRRLLLGGVATGLATLTWQPALFALAPVAAVVALAGSPGVRARATAAARYAVGGLLTLAGMVAYFALAGALDAFYEGFWNANAHFTQQPGLLDHPGRMWPKLLAWHGWTIWLLLGGLVLLPITAVTSVLGHRRTGRGAAGDPVALAALAAGAVGGLGWSLRAFNGAPDSFLLLPFAALGVGAGVATLATAVERPGVRARRALRTVVVGVVLGAVVTAGALTLQHTWRLRTDELDTDRALARGVLDGLPAGASVLSAQAPQPLALTGSRSISRFQIYGHGMKAYIADSWPGGLRQYVGWLRSRAPTVVFTSVRGFEGFMRPLARHYVLVGAGLGWLVYLHEDVDPATRTRVALALREAAVARVPPAG